MSSGIRSILAFLVVGLVGALFLLYMRWNEVRTQSGPRAQEINCINNLKQIGLAFKTWAVDHNGQFLLRVSTNQGGTLELCAPGRDTFDIHPAWHMMVMSNELSNPAILVCPQDREAKPAAS